METSVEISWFSNFGCGLSVSRSTRAMYSGGKTGDLNLAPASDALGVVRMGHTRRSLFLSREAGRESLANQIPQLHVSVVFQCLGSENLEKYQFKPAERHRDVVLLLIRAVVLPGDTSSTS